MPDLPLPFTCQHEAYDADAQDDHGNDIPDWADPVARACFWWSPSSAEPAAARSQSVDGALPNSGDRVSVDVMLVVDSTVSVDHRDRFTVGGKRFEVVGLPKDFGHGPFGFTPNRHVIELKWVG